ncbi:hypothetical protein ALP94_02838 [Pseudomonas savastanoi pv. glycinea]|nr:hypothetical protein ALP94_02838 [Pseudomonas savastanoi pv. glycinea]
MIGYVPHWEHSDGDEHALYGIAVVRGFKPYDIPLTATEALSQLEKSSDIKKIFKRVFDFISF